MAIETMLACHNKRRLVSALRKRRNPSRADCLQVDADVARLSDDPLGAEERRHDEHQPIDQGAIVQQAGERSAVHVNTVVLVGNQATR